MDDLISRQDAIEAIMAQSGVVDKSGAKRVLAQLPSAQPDRGYIEQIKWERDLAIRQLADLGYGLGEKPRTNGDLISRHAAIDALIAEGRNVDSRYIESERIIHEADAVEAISMLPSVQPDVHERNVGKWINNSPVTMKCDQCGYVIKDWRWNELNFCANCGADMRGERK